MCRCFKIPKCSKCPKSSRSKKRFESGSQWNVSCFELNAIGTGHKTNQRKYRRDSKTIGYFQSFRLDNQGIRRIALKMQIIYTRFYFLHYPFTSSTSPIGFSLVFKKSLNLLFGQLCVAGPTWHRFKLAPSLLHRLIDLLTFPIEVLLIARSGRL